MQDFFRRNSIFSLLFLFGLILLNGVGVTLPIPNLIQIGEQLNFPLIGIIEALFILFSMFALVVWGYFVDKYRRKPLLYAANIIWLFPAVCIFLFPNSLLIYVIGRLGMAVGLSALSPLAYSIIADFAEYKNRGLVSSGLNLAWVGSSAMGILLGAMFTSNWHYSFGLVTGLGIILLLCLFFLKIPLRGKKEPAFAELSNFQYQWRIKLSLLPQMMRTKSFLWLLLQGIFALIPGTVFTYWLVSFIASSEGMAVSIEIASVIAIIIASGRAPGYMIFGWLGDKLTANAENSAVRAKIASSGMFLQALFFFGAFLLLGPSLIDKIVFSLFFWIGSFLGAASGPNRTSLLFDISLPESRGTLGALYSLTDNLGAAFGVFISTLFLQAFEYDFVFITSLSFYILAALSWYRCVKYIANDQSRLEKILNERALFIINS
ncbi:MAG: MFS transporter [Candidatus Heimdallarchaeota archaeon]|nr:MFS transporter [Candidatus Heimdallarchaeota archaeon]